MIIVPYKSFYLLRKKTTSDIQTYKMNRD